MVETFHLWRGIRITDEIIYNLETDVSDTWGPKFFYLKKKISNKSLLFVKDKSTYGTVENFPYGHLCNTDTSPISSADNFLCPDRILLYSLYNKEPSWYRPSLMEENILWTSPSHGLFILREKKHSCACSRFYRHCNLKSYTVLNLIIRTNLLYGHFALSIGFSYYLGSSELFLPLYV